MKVWAWPVAGGLLACLFFAVGLGPLLGPLLYTMTPLERYYAGDYLRSTLHKNDASAMTGTRLLFKERRVPQPKPKSRKTKPELESKTESGFAREADVELLPLGDRLGKYDPNSFTLSDGARAEGWTVLTRDPSREFQSSWLESNLRNYVYDHHPLWEFFLKPGVGLAGLIVVTWGLGRWSEGLRRRYPYRRARETAWIEVREWSLASAGRLKDGMVRLPSRFHQLEGASPEALRALPAPAPVSLVAMRSPVAKPHPVVSSKRTEPGQESLPLTPQTVPVALPSAPVEPVAAPRQRAYVWDQSQGLD